MMFLQIIFSIIFLILAFVAYTVFVSPVIFRKILLFLIQIKDFDDVFDSVNTQIAFRPNLFLDYLTVGSLNHFNISPLIFIMLCGTLLFFIGFSGIIFGFRNIIVIFMSIEIMLFGFLIMILTISVQYNDFLGILFGLCTLAIAGAESAIGLAMLVNYYTINKDVSVKIMSNLKF